MRLWTLHPKYLDAQGLVALWREALLAQAVLRGRTRGYRFHPQIERFRACASPRISIASYLKGVFEESRRRGYGFDRSKVRSFECAPLAATDGQLAYEWEWLLEKLRRRNPALYRIHRKVGIPKAHPLFRIRKGPVADWERR